MLTPATLLRYCWNWRRVKKVWLCPFFGEVTLSDLSLPVLTLVLSAFEGFNPCAMWVLALLIGILLGVEGSRRKWILGLVFLGATGPIHFAALALG